MVLVADRYYYYFYFFDVLQLKSCSKNEYQKLDDLPKEQSILGRKECKR